MIADWIAAPEVQMQRLLFASLRTGAALALLPGIGQALLPLRARIGLSLAVGLLVERVARIEPGIGAVVTEIVVGAAIGVMLQAVFAAAQVAGELLSQSMGLGFATILSPGGMTSPVLTTFLSLTMWLAFVGNDGHLRLFALIVESYRSLPPGTAPDPLAVVRFGGTAFEAGLMLALPLASLLVLVNLWMAVVARSAPQLNLFSIGFATLMATGLAALPLALPALQAGMAENVAAGGDALAAVLR